jgi:predicted unusual protein kinase regulating ubiquinone biosynthesis (AarF/ABC1/UbiB family)
MPDRAQIDAARQGLKILRGMRGAAGKLAQLADFVDPAWAPADERPRLEEHLAELRAGAPDPVPFKRIERTLRDAWGGRVADHVAELDLEPAAMASAGQVHRGVLDDGREVAVKVLHPGLEEVLRADLGNLTFLAQLAASVVPGLDPRALAVEIRDRALEEMDLEHEAQAQRGFARAYRGHPFVHVPAPLTDLCHTEVLVSEWVEGTPFDAVCSADAATRDRYGEILTRFHAGAGLHTGQFHADPHPGNHRLLADGRVAILDFGSVGRAEPAWAAQLLDAADAAEAEDGDRFKRDLAALGYLVSPERVDGGWLAAHALRSAGRLRSGDAPVTIDLALAEELGEVQEAAARAVRDLAPNLRLPARDLLAGRMAGSLGAVLLRLEATAPWEAIAAEYRHGAEPATDLGVAERDFWAARGHSRQAAVQDLRRAA